MMTDKPVIVPDPNGKGWFIVVNTNHCDTESNPGMSGQILGNLKGYRDYHEAAEALAAMREA